MKREPLESSLLGLFRFFLVVQLLLILGNVLIHSRHGILSNSPWDALVYGVAGVAILLAYLSWPWLENRLGGLYLPLALVYSTVFSLILQDYFLGANNTSGKISSEESAWQLFLFLFVPLVLIAWQYNFKLVIVYCLFTAGFDYALMHFGYSDFATVADTYQRLLFIRALAFMVSGYVIARIMAQFRRQRTALEEANRELRHYAAAMEHLSISRERNRIAREMHDTLAHTLSGIAVQLEAAQSIWDESAAEARGMLVRSLALTRSGLGETRRALQDLRSAPLEELGLEQALYQLALDISQRGGFILDWQAGGQLPKLPPDVEQGIYRIAQESFENILRHAGASRVIVESTFQGGELTLNITDDGRGFTASTQNPQTHFGLRGMQERARMMDGELKILSQAGQGCTICLKIKG